MSVAIENGNQIAILVTSALSIFIATFFVALRMIAKHLSPGFDKSDYCIIIAMVFNHALHSCCILLVAGGGFGFHLASVVDRFGPDTATFFFQGIMSFALLWNATVCFSKLSVLLMYTTLIPIPSLIRSANIVGALVVVWNVSDVIASFLICRPIAKNWDPSFPGICGSQPAFYFAMGMINLITDAVVMALPIPYLLQLKIPLRRRIFAVALLSVGVGTWVITIYRQTLLPNLGFADMTHSGVLAMILSGLEPAVAIALACIPLLRPLMARHNSSRARLEYMYDSSNASPYPSRRKDWSTKNNVLSMFIEVENDHSSEVHLQPMAPPHPADEAAGGREHRKSALSPPETILSNASGRYRGNKS